MSVCGPSVRSMTRYVDEDLRGAEFRECDLTGARLVGVVMQDAVIDGLVTNLVVNGVDVTEYVEAELDRRHPVRVLIRSEDPVDLREAARQLRAGWAATIERIRRTPGIERRSVNDEWSAVQTLRHLVFVHDSCFRRCCLGSTELFTPMGIGNIDEPYRGPHGLDLSLDPSLDEIVSVRDAQAAELEAGAPLEFGPPMVAKPSFELLGDELLRLKRNADAAAAYASQLLRTPGRNLSVDGLNKSRAQ